MNSVSTQILLYSKCGSATLSHKVSLFYVHMEQFPSLKVAAWYCTDY